ncbi:MAG: thioredoxin family protein, partial [Clostridium sp.]
CHHCPLVVSAGQSIALLSPNVVCEMVDARLYPSLVEKYKISRVPAVIINDSALYMGEKDREELLKLLR